MRINLGFILFIIHRKLISICALYTYSLFSVSADLVMTIQYNNYWLGLRCLRWKSNWLCFLSFIFVHFMFFIFLFAFYTLLNATLIHVYCVYEILLDPYPLQLIEILINKQIEKQQSVVGLLLYFYPTRFDLSQYSNVIGRCWLSFSLSGSSRASRHRSATGGQLADMNSLEQAEGNPDRETLTSFLLVTCY